MTRPDPTIRRWRTKGHTRLHATCPGCGWTTVHYTTSGARNAYEQHWDEEHGAGETKEEAQ